MSDLTTHHDIPQVEDVRRAIVRMVHHGAIEWGSGAAMYREFCSKYTEPHHPSLIPRSLNDRCTTCNAAVDYPCINRFNGMEREPHLLDAAEVHS